MGIDPTTFLLELVNFVVLCLLTFALALVGVGVLFALGRYGFVYEAVTMLPLVGKFRAPARHIALVHLGLAILAAMAAYDVTGPEDPLLVIVGFALVALAFSSLGVLLGALLPSPRSAQALGVMLWFVMLMVGGAGPPPEVLTGAMKTVGDLTPLLHAVRTMQDGWLGLDPGYSWVVVAALIVVCGAASVRFFRWE